MQVPANPVKSEFPINDNLFSLSCILSGALVTWQHGKVGGKMTAFLLEEEKMYLEFIDND